MTVSCGRDDYVRQLIAAYRRLPGTLGRPRPADRQLAADLHRRGVPLDTVAAAFLLALARRATRPQDASPLPPIRSLHYLLPIIEELLQHPPPNDYLDNLRKRFGIRAQPSHSSATVQKTTLLHER